MKNIEIPLRLKSLKSKEQLINEDGLITVTKAISIKGQKDAYVEVMFDAEQKVVGTQLFGVPAIDSSLNLISTIPDEIDSPYKECEDKPSNMGVVLYVVNKISDKILSWF